MHVIKDHRFPVKVWVKNVEDLEGTAFEQLMNLSQMPFIHRHIAVMPDVHAGIGSTVGSVIPTKGAIIPAAVGVDIGCGMVAAHTSLNATDLPDGGLLQLRSLIEAAVPHGRTDNGAANDRGAWGTVPAHVICAWDELDAKFLSVLNRNPKIMGKKHPTHHLGTLGTGNHFIEICLDENNDVWIMLHSGSRGIGNKIGQYFIGLAKSDMERWFINLPDTDLAYFPEGSPNFDDYVQAMLWAQRFAEINRELMLFATRDALEKYVKRPFHYKAAVVNCHHNYASKEHHYGENVWVTRKGAVRARSGDLGIIPGSMGTGSFIVRGKGNPESFHSCSHGAGRRMSRTEARKRFTADDLVRETTGIECRKDDGVVDEIPSAYKSIGDVMTSQTDLVEVVHTLRQIVNVKG